MGIKCNKYYERDEIEDLGFEFDEEDERIIRYIKKGVKSKDNIPCEVYYMWRKKDQYAQVEVIKNFWKPCFEAFPSDSEIMDIAEKTGLERLCFFEKEVEKVEV